MIDHIFDYMFAQPVNLYDEAFRRFLFPPFGVRNYKRFDSGDEKHHCYIRVRLLECKVV